MRAVPSQQEIHIVRRRNGNVDRVSTGRWRDCARVNQRLRQCQNRVVNPGQAQASDRNRSSLRGLGVAQSAFIHNQLRYEHAEIREVCSCQAQFPQHPP